MTVCKKCGKQNDDNAKFCTGCGAELKAEECREQDESTQERELLSKPHKNRRKTVIAAALAAAIVLGGAVFGGKIIWDTVTNNADSVGQPLVYAKEGMIWLKGNNKKEPFTLTGLSGYMARNVYNTYDYNYGNLQVSSDGTKVFFADGISNGAFTLYYRKTSGVLPKGTDADEKGVCLASGVTSYKIAPDGSFVLYRKGDRLYYSDLKEEHSIASSVSSYYLSEDAQKVVFYKNSEDLYICGFGEAEEPEKIDVGVSNVISPLEEYEKIYYIKDHNLYTKEYGKEKVLITSDIYSADIIGDTVYVTREVKQEKRFSDLFEDEFAVDDTQMTEPKREDFTVVDVNTFFGTRTDYDAYHDAQKEYNKKKERDRIRAYYDENPQKISTYALYKVENDSLVENIADNLKSGYISQIMSQQAEGSAEKILFSTVESFSDAKNKVSNLNSETETNDLIILSDGNIVSTANANIDQEASYKEISADEKYFYCKENMDEEYVGTLNRYEITSSGLINKTKISDNVEIFSLYGDMLVILNDTSIGIYENETYTRLADGPVQDDAGKKLPQYVNGALYYYEDYSNNLQMGNLMRYGNGKKDIIDIDVHEFVIHDEACYYIKDYSIGNKSGELYKYDGGAQKIDSDVAYIIY